MKILVSHHRQIGDCVLSSSICQKLKEKYPDSELVFMTGSQIIADLLKHNPYIDKIQVYPYVLVFDNVYSMIKDKFDLPIYLLYWGDAGLDSWDGAVIRSFGLAAGFSLEESNALRPKIYYSEEDHDLADYLIEQEGIDISRTIIGGLDGGMETYRHWADGWCLDRGLRYFQADMEFSKKNNINFRQTGSLISKGLFAINQVGGWLHVAAASGVRTLGIPRRLNPRTEMPEYIYRDGRHISLFPKQEFRCDLFDHPSKQRPCSYVIGSSEHIAHEDETSCPPRSYKCEERITREQLEEGYGANAELD